jgi:hypothetical protein
VDLSSKTASELLFSALSRLYLIYVSRYLLRLEADTASKSSKDLANLHDKRTGLLRRIHTWREVQLIYIPHIASLLPNLQTFSGDQATSGEAEVATIPAEDMPLFLPSSLPAHIRKLPELQSICNLEQRLREPLANDALSDIRRQRRIIQGLWSFKRINISGSGNRPNTRMITLYQRFQSKTRRAVQKYRVARSALSNLDPNGPWQLNYKELRDSDISGPGRDPEDSSTTSSRYEPSWIWLMPRVEQTSNSQTVEDEFNDCMRVEWAKARARMMRWKEEVEIVQEEMRRVIVYHRWKAGWWQRQSVRRISGDSDIRNGLVGYAHKQAAICMRMAEQCVTAWLPHLKGKGANPSWGADYTSLLAQCTTVNMEVEQEQEHSGDIP